MLPSLDIASSRFSDKALTTETPTPCKPPETLYELSSNLPPACKTVIITSAAGFFSSGCMSTGMPLPLSETVTELSTFISTVIASQCPAKASSIELSTTSKTI